MEMKLEFSKLRSSFYIRPRCSYVAPFNYSAIFSFCILLIIKLLFQFPDFHRGIATIEFQPLIRCSLSDKLPIPFASLRFIFPCNAFFFPSCVDPFCRADSLISELFVYKIYKKTLLMRVQLRLSLSTPDRV